MKYLVFFIALLAQDVSAQSDIIQRVPGTKVCLIIPEGFRRVSKMGGFVYPGQNATIMVMETSASFKEVAAGFDRKRMQNDGITVLVLDSIVFNGVRALRLKTKPPEEGIPFIRNILLFGDDTYTVMIDGTYPDTSGLEQTIENSLFTAVYHKTLNVDPQEGLKFRVSPELEGFTFNNSFSGLLTYNLIDSAKAIRLQGPTFVISSAPNRDSISNFRQYAIDMLVKTSGVKQYNIATMDSVVIDGLRGFEITAYDTKRHTLLYEMILYPTANDYYLLTGNAAGQTSLSFETYRRIARTFKRK